MPISSGRCGATSDLKYWLALNHVPRVGPATFGKLMEVFGSPEAAVMASREALRKSGVLNESQIDQLIRRRERIEELEGWIEELTFDGVAILTIQDERYPRMLRTVVSAPPLIYVRGTLEPSDERAVAVVGTRSPTEAGARTAYELAGALARAGITVVSGLAVGIDGAAHEGALDARGRTIAVLGSGILRVHPREHVDLAERIAECGAVLTEVQPRASPSVSNLMARNRLQVALSRAVVVVQTGLTGGSMSTVDYARKFGRLLFAVASEEDCPQTQGPRRLIREGALPLRGIADLDILLEQVDRWEPPEPESGEASPPQLELF